MIHLCKYILIPLFSLSLVVTYTKSEVLFNSIPNQNYNNWETIVNKKVYVGWMSHGDQYWCRSKSTLNYNLEKVAGALENYQNYPNIFKRVTDAKEIDKNIVHIVLNMPYPFANRDYVVEFETSKGKSTRSIKFSSLEDNMILSIPESVRLINAAGEWYLEEKNKNSTEITYTWNGELRGRFPSYALTRAWKTQGVEVMNWLDEYLHKKERTELNE